MVMYNNTFKPQIKKPVIASTTAEKLKVPEYSVDKSPKKSAENPDLTPKNSKR
jgi:hypothetical protein